MKYMLKGRRYYEHQLLLLLLMLSYHSTDMVSLILLQVRRAPMVNSVLIYVECDDNVIFKAIAV